MRCFIAIDLPYEIKDKLINLQNNLRDIGKINWVAKKNLHLTLKFLGEVNEKELEETKERLSKIEFESFKTSLSELGVFPNENFIRVIWIGLKPAGKIIELQQKIDSELLDLFPKDQGFQTHLTIGRVKFIKNKGNIKEKLNLEVEGEFEIKEFKLFKSELTKDGPKYSILKTYNLR